jgi:hypothetical protein
MRRRRGRGSATAASLHARASTHRSFKSVTMHRAEEKSHPESATAILAKTRFWRAAMRREAGEHENFFIAKNCDSESAQRAFNRRRESQRHRLRIDAAMHESRKCLRRSRFL